jgi:hypothetical protein
MLPVWVKSLSTWSIITGIAINPATKWLIAHSRDNSPSNYLLILDPDGKIKGAYTYTGIPNYHKFWRNLLLGYDSPAFNYIALVQTSLSSGNGYKLFAF